MINAMLKDVIFDKVINYTAAGTSDTINGDILDMAGYDGVCLVLATGDCANTAVVTLKAYQGDASNLSDGAYNSTTAAYTCAASDADNKLLILDIKGITDRYVRADVVRATANIAIDSVIAIRYNGSNCPVTQSSDVIATGTAYN